MNLHVVASSPSIELSGANVLVANLLDQLHNMGVKTEWIVTGHNPSDDAAWLGARQFKLHRLPPTKISDVRQRQKLLQEYLTERAPCVYLPNFDFDMACVAPALSAGNSVVLIVHCDDKDYYNFVAEHGRLFNSIVCVSSFLAARLGSLHPELRSRIKHIPFGIEPPSNMPARTMLPGQRLKVAYCGRISFHQKRVQDLARIINQCHADNRPVQFEIAGTGQDETPFFESIKGPLTAGKVSRLGLLPNSDVLKLLGRADILIMTSEFEGLPMVLLEGMSRGCIPVVTKTESGMDELVQDGVNGYLVSVGDIDGFLQVLAGLSADRSLLLRLRCAAVDRIHSGGFTLVRAAADYATLFESLTSLPERRSVKRNRTAIIPGHYRVQQRILLKVKTLLRRA